MNRCPYTPVDFAIYPYYIGMQSELQQALDGTFHSAPVFIIGARRMGKTSFLHELKRRLDEDSKNKTVYIDMVGFSGATLADLLIKITNRLDNPNQTEFGKAQTLEDLLDFVSKSSSSKPERFIILLDEIEKIADKAWATELLEQLRSIMSERTHAIKVGLVASIAYENINLFYSEEGNLPNFQTVYLRPFSKDEFETLARAGGEIPSEQVLREIWEQTGAHPNFCQFIFSQLWQRHDGKISQSTPTEIPELAKLYPERYIHLSYVFNKVFKTRERFLYQLISEQTNCISRTEINEQLRLPINEITEALKVLEQNTVIRKKGDGYIWSGSMFHSWAKDRFLKYDFQDPKTKNQSG